MPLKTFNFNWMKTSFFIKLSMIVCLPGFFFIKCHKEPKNQKPNIILVITDDQGYGDISAHGSPDVNTPAMDKLKSQGISFDDFQVSPTCAPTRSAIMTGRHPFKNGITHTILERERMALGLITLPQVLKRGGYTCGIFGKWHLGDEDEYQPGNRGFDEVFIHGGGGIGQVYPGSCADVPDNKYFDPVVNHNGIFVKTKGFCTDIFFDQASSWIKSKLKDGKPFFAYISTNAPHGPFIAPEKNKEKFKIKGYPEYSQGFYGMIENVDENLGKLMERVDKWGIANNTVLIFMSDNGKTTFGEGNTAHGETYNAGLKGFKGSPHEGGTKVPFFIRWPGKLDAGRTVESLQNHYDILPSLAEIADIDISDILNLDGQSFFPYLMNKSYKGDERYRFIHCGRWPLHPNNVSNQLLNPNWLGTEESSNPDNHKYKNCAVRNERYRLVNNSELYDIINDLGETTDISSQYPKVVENMRKEYDKWWNDVRPLMINEHIPLAEEKPYWINYYKQKELQGIPDWKLLDFE